jgi:hypothetical protein
MSLFVCDGDCQGCTEKKDCPYKDDIEVQEQILYDKLMNFVQDELINPKVILKMLQEDGLSMFNVINAWDIEGGVISSDEITQYLISYLPEDLKEEMPSDIESIFQEAITTIVQKIESILHRTCHKGECHSCLLRDCCPQMMSISIKK